MAGVFYARYVPPAADHKTEESSQNFLGTSNVHDSTPRPSRKRKRPAKFKADTDSTNINPHAEPSPLDELSRNGGGLVRDEDKGILEEDTKHTKIKSKFGKSQEISARLKKQSQYSNITDVNGTENPVQNHESEAIHAKGLVPIPQPAESTPPPIPSAFSALPEWIQEPIFVDPSLSVPFKDLRLRDSALESLKAKGFENAFAIQAGIISMLLKGRGDSGDICISAATGSGKTLAYTLPIVEALKHRAHGRLRTLVVVPTRELVSQVREAFQVSIAGTPFTVGTAVGNRTMKEERRAMIRRTERHDPEAWNELRKPDPMWMMKWPSYDDSDDELDTHADFVRDYESKVDILICTPGRLVEHIRHTKGFSLACVEWLVIDEADKLLDHSFQQWIKEVIPPLHCTPPKDHLYKHMQILHGSDYHRRVHKIILSATMTRDMSKLIPLKLWFPRLVVMGQGLSSLAGNLESDNIDHGSLTVPSTLSEVAIAISGVEQKPLYLLRLLTSDPKSLLEQKSARESVSVTKLRIADSDSDLDDSSMDSSNETDSSLDSDSNSDSAVLSARNPKEPFPKIPNTLVFTHSSESAHRLRRLLSILNPSLGSMLYTLTKSQPKSHLRTIIRGLNKKSHNPLIIIASDRASRGLDIPHLKRVINYDMPTSVKTYVHRVGRTARAGKRGHAVTFVEKKQGRWFWGESGRGKGIRWEGGKAVKRVDWRRVEFGEEERKRYEEALEKLGVEAKGSS